MPAAEYDAWADFRGRRGYPTDRLTLGIAKGLAAVCNVWGGKTRPADLLPQFGGPGNQAGIIASAEAFFGPADDVTNPPGDNGG